MLWPLCRLVDCRTECKLAGGAAGTPIKDVWGIHVTGVPRAVARRGPAVDRHVTLSAGARRPAGRWRGSPGGDEVLVAPV